VFKYIFDLFQMTHSFLSSERETMDRDNLLEYEQKMKSLKANKASPADIAILELNKPKKLTAFAHA